jgi:hypothetical protein
LNIYYTGETWDLIIIYKKTQIVAHWTTGDRKNEKKMNKRKKTVCEGKLQSCVPFGEVKVVRSPFEEPASKTDIKGIRCPHLPAYVEEPG